MAKKYTDRELLDYNFNANDDANYRSAAEKAAAADTKYNSIGDWKYGDEDVWSKAKDALTNRKAFSYDLNGDALYQQYKDNYITQGKQAMMDTMGQAAAMTGGYGNSYAATVGNQTYQGYLQGLNDKVPELYQMAMQRYNLEGDQLKTAYDVLNSDRELDYSKFIDNKNSLFNEMSHYNTLKDAAYTQAQTNYNNQLTSNNDNYWNEYNTGYQAAQDKIANELAREQLNLQKDSQKIAELQAGVVRDKNGKIVSVAMPTSDSGYNLTKDQEDRLFGYINSSNWEAADKYIEAMKANGMTDEQAKYWTQLIPEAYWKKQGLIFDNPFGPFNFGM